MRKSDTKGAVIISPFIFARWKLKLGLILAARLWLCHAAFFV
jgi:hypothetical protein